MTDSVAAIGETLALHLRFDMKAVCKRDPQDWIPLLDQASNQKFAGAYVARHQQVIYLDDRSVQFVP